jgi:septal ring factor EnvC (AmiA/AmiB activator)
MKTVLASILLTLVIIATSSSHRFKKGETNIDNVIKENDKHISKAHAVNKIADQQQKEKVEEMLKTINQLKKEKKQLETTLIKTNYKLQIIKVNVIDTSEYMKN